MDPFTYRILDTKRHGGALTPDDIRAAVEGAASGSWGDAELGALLMAIAIQGLDPAETRELTLAMLESGEQWQLSEEIPTLGDKHSTGGVGDKVSLILAPLMAACGRPIVMLTGRGLGHTGGTADKLEAIPGLRMEFDRALCLKSLEETGLAIGIATTDVAAADRRLYGLRDRTATVASLPLITGSILSKKLATGAASIVFDVKTGNGAFLPKAGDAEDLARLLVDTSEALGCRARALVTDMSQPLGRWIGHSSEIREALDCLDGHGPTDLLEVTFNLSEELSELTGSRLTRAELQKALTSGQAMDCFLKWAALQGSERGWLTSGALDLAPHEVVLEAPRGGHLGLIKTRRLGELMAQAGGGRLEPGGKIDNSVALKVERNLGDEVHQGDPLARLFLRQEDEGLVQSFSQCFEVHDHSQQATLVLDRIRPSD